MAGEPQDQFVEEQDDGVVAERLRMLRHDRQAPVQRHKTFAPGDGQVPRGLKEGVHQVAHQTYALVRCGRCLHGGLKALGIPAAPEAPPAAIRPLVAAESGEKHLIAHGGAETPGISEQPLPLVKPRRRGLGAEASDVIGVLPEHR